MYIQGQIVYDLDANQPVAIRVPYDMETYPLHSTHFVHTNGLRDTEGRRLVWTGTGHENPELWRLTEATRMLMNDLIEPFDPDVAHLHSRWVEWVGAGHPTWVRHCTACEKAALWTASLKGRR